MSNKLDEFLYENTGNFLADDPELHVLGMGIMKLSLIKELLSKHFSILDRALQENRWDLIRSKLYDSGVIKAYLDALLQYEKDLKTHAN